MRTVAILGTAADPVTLGHTALMKLAQPHFDEVWLLPAGEHQFGKEMRPAAHRLAMARLAVEPLGSWAQVSDFEIAEGLDGATIRTHAALAERYPDHRFHWLIGMDNALCISRWAGFPRLLDEVPFVVCSRPGYEAGEGDERWWELDCWDVRHRFLPGADWPGSSSNFRLLLDASLVDPEVFRYQQEHGLYR